MVQCSLVGAMSTGLEEIPQPRNCTMEPSQPQAPEIEVRAISCVGHQKAPAPVNPHPKDLNSRTGEQLRTRKGSLHTDGGAVVCNTLMWDLSPPKRSLLLAGQQSILGNPRTPTLKLRGRTREPHTYTAESSSFKSRRMFQA